MKDSLTLRLQEIKKRTGENIRDLLSGRYIKCNYVQDLEGVEYASILKNIYAIACGIARGLNYGDNFQAVLVSNAMQEMEIFFR